MQPFPERRRFPRLSFTELVRFRDVFKPQEAYSGALAKDVGAGGIRITLPAFLPEESRLVLLVDLPGRSPVRAISRIAWIQKGPLSDRGHDCGLEFIGISPEDRAAVAEHVEREMKG